MSFFVVSIPQDSTHCDVCNAQDRPSAGLMSSLWKISHLFSWGCDSDSSLVLVCLLLCGWPSHSPLQLVLRAGCGPLYSGDNDKALFSTFLHSRYWWISCWAFLFSKHLTFVHYSGLIIGSNNRLTFGSELESNSCLLPRNNLHIFRVLTNVTHSCHNDKALYFYFPSDTIHKWFNTHFTQNWPHPPPPHSLSKW